MKNGKVKVLVLFLFFLCSCDNGQIQPGFSGNGPSAGQKAPAQTGVVKEKQVTHTYEAVGTIRPVTESVIESQVSAKITKVLFTPGKTVRQGEVLIELDSRQLETRGKQANEGLSVAQNSLSQTRKAMDEAKANLDQAKAAYERTQKLFDAQIVPVQKLEIDKAAFLQSKARLEKAMDAVQTAKAAVRQSEQVVKEAGISIDYATLTAPASGVVAKRLADPGDLAVPGKPLMIIQTSGALRLEANVREGLIAKVALGGEYQVSIETVNKTVQARVEEIVPYADPATRTFLVKAALPETPGVYPGMFGRLLIPVGKESTLVVPRQALIKVGQLEQVLVQKQDTWQRVYVKTGKTFDDGVEVLAGLVKDETIGWGKN